MSTLNIKVIKIEDVQAHKNADKLEIVTLLGWKTCTQKGLWKVGDLAVWIPYDSCITKEMADKLGVTQYLKGKDKNRVGRINLRGEPSFGIVAPILFPGLKEGNEVSQLYGVSKYEPPINSMAMARSSQPKKRNPLLQKYTEIENLRNFNNIFIEGEEVFCTEKIHGTLSVIGMINKEWVCSSKGVQRQLPGLEEDFFRDRKKFFKRLFRKIYYWFMKPSKPDKNKARLNWWWFPYSILEVRNLIEGLSKQYKQVLIYGETFGSVQYLHYNVQETIESPNRLDWRCFDILLDGKYVDIDEFLNLCNVYGIKYAPILYRGPYSLEKIKEISSGLTLINNASNIREGLVCKPIKERTCHSGRVILKYISDQYLLDKKSEENDTTDF